MKIGVFAHNRDFFGAKLIHIPLIYTLYSKYKGAEISILTPYKNNELFLKTGIVKNVFFYKSNLFNILKILNENKFNMIISLRNKSIPVNLGVLFAKAEEKIGFSGGISNFVYKKSVLYRKDIYRAVLFNSLIENPLPINEYFKRFDCDLRLKSIAYKKIFILPGAGGDFKKWDIDNFIKVCEWLGQNFYYVFVCGEREKKDLQVIDNFLSKYRGEVLYSQEVDKLINYFHAGDLFISNDCGPSHIARMMLKPIITIYSNFYGDGEKVIKEWFLTYKNSHYLLGEHGKSINTVKVEDVIERVNKILS